MYAYSKYTLKISIKISKNLNFFYINYFYSNLNANIGKQLKMCKNTPFFGMELNKKK